MTEQDKKGQEKKEQDRREREKTLDLAISQIEKQVGKGSVIRLGSRPATPVESISSGSLGLDIALGVGGIPRGRVIEIFGPEASGKTTLTLQMIASVQRVGGTAVFIDAEHALDPSYAKKIGVDTDNLYVSQPDTGEDALEIADQLVRSGAVDVVAIDSVAALVPRAEIEGEMGDAHVGLQARLMSQALRKLTGSISRSRTIVIFINQIRMKIGVMFGNPETTTGGNALKFYSSIRLDIRRISSIKEGEETIGNRTRVRVVKNKVAPPFRSAEFDILFREGNEGIDRWGELIDQGLAAGLLQKTGTWISYGEERLGQGREQSRQTLKQNAALAQKLDYQIRVAAGLPIAGRGNGDDRAAVSTKEVEPGKEDPAAGAAKGSTGAEPRERNSRAGAESTAKSEPARAVREAPSASRRPGASPRG